MQASHWYLAFGLLFLLMAAAGALLKRLPLTTGLIYLGVGVLLGPGVFDALPVSLSRHATIIEHATELAVLSALFTAGLRLRKPLGHKSWFTAVRLASVGMLVSVSLITLVGYRFLHLPLGSALLLGGLLSPTDPVLAADVQIKAPHDRDHVRFSLTAEAGLNDGTAFPFVLLGIALLRLGGNDAPIRPILMNWITRDVLWAAPAGIACGYAVGWIAAKTILALRGRMRETFEFDDFVAFGVLALSYALSHFVHGYGFLAVFAAGLAFRRIEMHTTPIDLRAQGNKATEGNASEEDSEEKNEAQMARRMLEANEQMERLGEVLVVVLVGALLTRALFTASTLWFVAFVFFVCRPVSVLLSWPRGTMFQKGLMAWFGVRGIGSLYYLAFASAFLQAKGHMLDPRLVDLTLATIAFSALAHGVSVTPLMGLYERVTQRPLRRAKASRVA